SETLPAPGRSVVCNAIGARSPARLLSKWRNHPPLGGTTTTVSELTCSHTHDGMGATVATRGAHNVAACCRLLGGNPVRSQWWPRGNECPYCSIVHGRDPCFAPRKLLVSTDHPTFRSFTAHFFGARRQADAGSLSYLPGP